MAEVMDADIAEALQAWGYYALTPQYIRESAAKDGYQNAKWIMAHAATIAKLRVAVEALEKAKDAIHHQGGPLCSARYYSDAKCNCGAAGEADAVAAALAQIKGEA